MRSLILLVALISCDACDEEEGKPLASAAQTDDSIKPVYPAKVGEVAGVVTRLCEALHAVPRERKAACCKTNPGAVLTSECERNLTGALASGVAIDEKRVAECEQAIEAMHSTCDWIGPWQSPTPAQCLGLIRGSKRAGAACSSNLECEEGLRCLGLGPTDPGVCGAPSPIGSLCGAAVDPLAVYARQDDVDTRHPQCAGGYCDRNRCVPLVDLGGGCNASVQCANGSCVEGECVEGAGGCSGGDCGPGMRCIAGTCQEPKSIGESCSSDSECKSACVAGKCQMRCISPAILRGLIKTKSSTN